LNRPIVLG